MISVPFFDELSVKNIWPHMQKAGNFMMFFPDKLPKGRLLVRRYFFNVLNKCNSECVPHLIQHANLQRHTIVGEQR